MYRPFPGVASWLTTVVCCSALALVGSAQPPAAKDAGPTPGAEEKEQLLQKIQTLKALARKQEAEGTFAEARRTLQEVVDIRMRLEGKDHWRTADARRAVEDLALRQKMMPQERKEHQEAIMLNNRVVQLKRAGKSREALVPAKLALSIRRRLLGDRHPATATCLNNLTVLYLEQGDCARALPLCQQALEIRKAVLGDRHPDTAASLNSLALLYQHLGDYPRALPLYQQALEIIKEVQGDMGPETAATLNNLAMLYRDQGEYSKALPLSQQALEISKTVWGDKHPKTAISLSNLAGLYAEQADYARALPLHQQALEVCKVALGDRHPDTATSLNNLALLYSRQTDYARALPLYQQALEVRKAALGERHPRTATSLNNLALLYQEQGDYARALPLYQQALEIRKAVLGDRHPDTATSLNNLALLYQEQGDYARALPLYRQALEIRKVALGERHPRTATSLNNLALLHIRQEDYARALPLYQQALEIRKVARGDKHPDTASSLNNLASLYHNQGDYARALPLYQQTLEIRKAVLGDRHPDTANSLNNLALLYQKQGDYARALPLCQQALEIYKVALGDKHPQTATSLNNLAYLYQDQGDYARAEEWFREGAEVFLNSRGLIVQQGMERAAYTSINSRLLAFCAVLAHNGKPAEAWHWLENSLGSSTWDELSARQILADAEQTQLQRLQGHIQQGQKRLEQLASLKTLSEDQKTLQKKWFSEQADLYAELAQFNQHLRQKYGVLAGDAYPVKKIQSALPPDTALVTWVDLQDGNWAVVVRSEGDPIWVRVPGSGEKGSWTKDEVDLCLQFRQHVISPALDWQELAAALTEQRLGAVEKQLEGLTHLVVLPSPWMDGIPVELLAGGRTVSYVPSGTIYTWLQEKPPASGEGLLAMGDPVFEQDAAKQVPLLKHGLLLTAVVPKSNAFEAGLRVDDVLLSCNGVTLNTIDDLRTALERPSRGDLSRVRYWRQGKERETELKPGQLGVTFAKEPAPVVLAKRHKDEQFFATLRGGDWKELPGTRAEVESLHALFKKGGQSVTVLTDSAASEQNLQQMVQKGEMRGYRYLHFATHGETNHVNHLQSAIILSLDQLPGTAEAVQWIQQGKAVPDGRLTAKEVLQHWKLDAELVTLSVCESGLGKKERGEGFMGFSQAFLLSGARSVVLSLWKVDDTATALLMARFYENLLGQREGIKPMPKAKALAEAKQWLRTLPRDEVLKRAATITKGVARGKGRKDQPLLAKVPEPGKPNEKDEPPYAHPHYWAAFILVGDPG